MRILFTVSTALALQGCQDVMQTLEDNLPKPSATAQAMSSVGSSVSLKVVFVALKKSDLDCASQAAVPHVKSSMQISNIGSIEKSEWGLPFIYRKTQTPASYKLDLSETYTGANEKMDLLVDALKACRTDRNTNLNWSVTARQTS